MNDFRKFDIILVQNTLSRLDFFDFPYQLSLYYYGYSNKSTSNFDFPKIFTEFLKTGCGMDYEVIDRLMKEKGVKASDVAKATGIPSSVFTDWKKGRYTPKADKLYVLAKYFEVPMETFFEPEHIQSETTETYSREELTPRVDYFVKLLEDKELYLLIERIINSPEKDRERFIQIGKLMGLIE